MTIKKLKDVNISGFKLVLPTVSTGNVAQLSADLFIESLKMEKFAIVRYFLELLPANYFFIRVQYLDLERFGYSYFGSSSL